MLIPGWQSVVSYGDWRVQFWKMILITKSVVRLLCLILQMLVAAAQKESERIQAENIWSAVLGNNIRMALVFSFNNDTFEQKSWFIRNIMSRLLLSFSLSEIIYCAQKLILFMIKNPVHCFMLIGNVGLFPKHDARQKFINRTSAHRTIYRHEIQ